jgi:hypothetical protein
VRKIHNTFTPVLPFSTLEYWALAKRDTILNTSVTDHQVVHEENVESLSMAEDDSNWVFEEVIG